MADQLPLPQEIAEMIGDMACTKRSNGGESNNILLIVSTNRDVDPESVEDDVVQWVLRGLSDPRFDCLKEWETEYPWKVVSTVKDDGRTSNDPGCIVVAVRIGQDRGRWLGCEHDETGLIIVDESPPLPSAKADDVREALPPEPAFLTGVGNVTVDKCYGGQSVPGFVEQIFRDSKTSALRRKLTELAVLLREGFRADLFDCKLEDLCLFLENCAFGKFREEGVVVVWACNTLVKRRDFMRDAHDNAEAASLNRRIQ